MKRKTDLEKKRFNADGEELYYDETTGIWAPHFHLPTEEEILKFNAQFSHPKFSFISIFLNISIPIFLTFMIVIFLNVFFSQYFILLKKIEFQIIITSIILLSYILIRLKHIVIFVVKLYQRFAPMHVRQRCVFTPTCSDYMILSIKKFGLIRGVIKGIKRLKRCEGDYREDYP